MRGAIEEMKRKNAANLAGKSLHIGLGMKPLPPAVVDPRSKCALAQLHTGIQNEICWEMRARSSVDRA